MTKNSVIFGLCFAAGILGTIYIVKWLWKKKPNTIKINDDTLTTVVVFSLGFCVFISLWGMILTTFGIDCADIVGAILLIFGTELGICGLLKIYDKYVKKEEQKQADRKAGREQRAKQRQEQLERDEKEKEEWLKEGMAG